jgi:hypothetical protein
LISFQNFSNITEVVERALGQGLSLLWRRGETSREGDATDGT